MWENDLKVCDRFCAQLHCELSISSNMDGKRYIFYLHVWYCQQRAAISYKPITHIQQKEKKRKKEEAITPSLIGLILFFLMK